VALLAFAWSTHTTTAARYWLEAASTAPAVLDSPVLFKVVLRSSAAAAVTDEDVYVFKWSDDASPAHWQEQKTTGTSANLTLTYPSARYRAREYKLEVSAYKEILGVYRSLLARTSLNFDITRQLTGWLAVNGVQRPAGGGGSDALVSAANQTVIEAKLHDPLGFLKGARLVYYWFLNDTNFGLTPSPVFNYRFAHPGTTKIEATVIAYLPSNATFEEASASHNADGLRREMLSRERTASAAFEGRYAEDEHHVKLGLLRTGVRAVSPLTRLNVSGQTVLRHGKLVDLDFSCDGSGPWISCWSIKPRDYNVTGNESCSDPETLSTSCEFPVMWFFREPETYNILAHVSNGVGKATRLVSVTVYEIHPQTPISFVLTPVLSIVAACVALMLACYGFRSYRRNLSVEVADFDFARGGAGVPGDDGELGDDGEVMTFWERLRRSAVAAVTVHSARASRGGASVSRASSSAASVGAVGTVRSVPVPAHQGGAGAYGTISN